MNNKSRGEAALNNTLRVEAMIDLAAAIAGDCFEHPSGALDDFINALFPGDGGRVNDTMKPLIEAAQGCDEDEEEIAYRFVRSDIDGYAIQFATPVYISATKTSATYTWGHYYTQWIYGDTIAAAWRAGIKWAKEMRKKHIAETKAKDKARAVAEAA